jgi:hypothetical protein
MYIFLVLISIALFYIFIVLVINSVIYYDLNNNRIVEKATKFLFEDGNEYWFTIEEYSDSYKIMVYKENPLSFGKYLIFNEYYSRIGYNFTKSYDEDNIEFLIKSILNPYVKKINSKSNLKNFKGYVGDIPKSKLREYKIKKLGIKKKYLNNFF